MWDQANEKNICKDTQNDIQEDKNSLRALAFSLIDLDNCQVFKDKRNLEIIKILRKELVIFRPDKGNAVLLVGTSHYYTAVENLISDKYKI